MQTPDDLVRITDRTGISKDKMPLCLAHYGNTSSASIPMALSDMYGDNMATDKKRVLMCGFGVGLSWGVVSAEISPVDIYPIEKTNCRYDEGIIEG